MQASRRQDDGPLQHSFWVFHALISKRHEDEFVVPPLSAICSLLLCHFLEGRLGIGEGVIGPLISLLGVNCLRDFC